MFRSARIKLTLWYLVIIMMMSLSFSAAIYGMLDREINRIARAPRIGAGWPMGVQMWTLDQEWIDEVRARLLWNIGVVNGAILLGSAILGYMLAGKTLQPIQEMVEEQRRFVSDASHELRTPLTAMKTAMEVHLRNSKSSLKEANSLIEDSLDQVNQMQNLAEGLLTLASFKENKQDKQICDLEIVVQKAIKKLEPIAKVKKIKVEYDGKKIKLEGRETQLTDLLVILLDNAIKYSPEGETIKIETGIKGGWAKIKVADNGIGIKKDELSHIFDRFYRADAARSKATSEGYGLGLAIAKKITDGHGGTIEVKSKSGKGSVFTVSIPGAHIDKTEAVDRKETTWASTKISERLRGRRR